MTWPGLPSGLDHPMIFRRANLEAIGDLAEAHLAFSVLAALVAIFVAFRPDRAIRTVTGLVAHDICAKALYPVSTRKWFLRKPSLVQAFAG